MQKIKEKTLELIHKYDDALEAKGIRIVLTQRYVETDVRENSVNVNSRQATLDTLEYAYYLKREKKKKYNFEKKQISYSCYNHCSYRKKD